MATVTAPTAQDAPAAPAPAIITPAAPAAAPATQPLGNSSLYVGDLDRDVTEAQLFELFSQVGPVASIRVCRDAVTRRSLGYAYVNYNTALDVEAGERALENLNYTPINGKPVRIMWSHRDPSVRKHGVGNIFIKNLDKSIDNKALHDTFSAFGRILSCKVATDNKADSKGYGFVHFETEEAAQLAIDKVNGMMIEDKIVYVGPFLKRADRPASRELFTNVFIKNLHQSVSDEELRKMCEEFGTVTSLAIMKDDKGASKGFGFVNFEDAEAAGKCVDALQGKEIQGKVMYAGRAQKKSEREALLKQKYDEVRQERIAKYQGMNLYVKNLSDDVDDDVLREEFTPFGTITSAKVMRDDKGKSKGFGFVCYTSHEEASRAVTEMNTKMLKGKPVYVALAQRKDVRKAQLESQASAATIRPGAMAGGRQPGPMQGMPYGSPAPMFYAAGPGGMGQRPGPGMMYPPMIGGPGGNGRGMGPGGRGPRGGPMMGPGGPMMGPGGYGGPPGGFPGGFPGGPAGGRGGRGGRGMRQGGGGYDDGSAGGYPGGYMAPAGGRGMGPGGFPGPGGYPPQMQGQPGFGGPGFQGGRGGRGGRGAPGRGRGAGPAPPPPNAPPPPAQQAAATAAPAAAPPPPPAPVEAANLPLSAAMLAAASPEQQKQMIGERLFPAVAKVQPELAGKITGMLLEMDNAELLVLLDSSEALLNKVEEAIAVLKQHNAIPEGVVLAEMPTSIPA